MIYLQIKRVYLWGDRIKGDRKMKKEDKNDVTKERGGGSM